VKVNFSSRSKVLMYRRLLRCLVRGERGIEYLQMTVNISWKLWIDAEDVSGSDRIAAVDERIRGESEFQL